MKRQRREDRDSETVSWTKLCGVEEGGHLRCMDREGRFRRRWREGEGLATMMVRVKEEERAMVKI